MAFKTVKVDMLDGSTRLVDRAAISYGVYDFSAFPKGRKFVPASETPIYGWTWLDESKPVVIMHVGIDIEGAAVRQVDVKTLTPLLKRELKGFMMAQARGAEKEAVKSLFFEFKRRSCGG